MGQELEMTPVFPPHVKPVRVGLYKVWVNDTGCEMTAADVEEANYPFRWGYWGGKRWGTQSKYAERASGSYCATHPDADQNKWWRGLANDPVPRNPNWPPLGGGHG